MVELNEDVSFLVVMPPPERVCMPPGSEDAMREIGNTITMPIPLFDIGKGKGGEEMGLCAVLMVVRPACHAQSSTRPTSKPS